MIAQNIQFVRSTMPEGVQLVAVSKFHPVEALAEAYAAGQRIFGESHVQELVAKETVLPKDIQWHFIGHLQTNKVKYIAPFVSLIHAVDSLKLLSEINRQAERVGRTIPCLLQVHVAQEETKFGFTPEELRTFLSQGEWRSLPHAQISGLMAMATNTEDENQIDREFSTVEVLFREVKDTFFSQDGGFCQLSMGMSDDYPIALRHGATLIRVGSRIFGQRIYNDVR